MPHGRDSAHREVIPNGQEVAFRLWNSCEALNNLKQLKIVEVEAMVGVNVDAVLLERLRNI